MIQIVAAAAVAVAALFGSAMCATAAKVCCLMGIRARTRDIETVRRERAKRAVISNDARQDTKASKQVCVSYRLVLQSGSSSSLTCRKAHRRARILFSP